MNVLKIAKENWDCSKNRDEWIHFAPLNNNIFEVAQRTTFLFRINHSKKSDFWDFFKKTDKIDITEEEKLQKKSKLIRQNKSYEIDRTGATAKTQESVKFWQNSDKDSKTEKTDKFGKTEKCWDQSNIKAFWLVDYFFAHIELIG